MTVNQRDIFALYCLKEGIESEPNIRKKMDEYMRIREIVGRCAEEKNVQEETNRD